MSCYLKNLDCAGPSPIPEEGKCVQSMAFRTVAESVHHNKVLANLHSTSKTE